MRDIAPGVQTAEIISFAEAKAAKAAPSGLDVDAWLAARGLDRADVEDAFVKMGLSEADVPAVVRLRSLIKMGQEGLTSLRETAATLQEQIADREKIIRNDETGVIIEKLLHMQQILTGEPIDAEGARSLPKGRRKRKCSASS